jgi:hypothetical protein
MFPGGVVKSAYFLSLLLALTVTLLLLLENLQLLLCPPLLLILLQQHLKPTPALPAVNQTQSLYADLSCAILFQS